jgi:hypothetical protein
MGGEKNINAGNILTCCDPFQGRRQLFACSIVLVSRAEDSLRIEREKRGLKVLETCHGRKLYVKNTV